MKSSLLKPPVVLLAFANDNNNPKRHLRALHQERSELYDLLQAAQKKGICEVVLIPDATLDRIVGKFQEEDLKGRIAIFHFAGHANEYILELVNKYDEKTGIYADGFAGFLGLQKGLQLVFLNACSTSSQAVHLHAANIPAVLSTKTKVDDTIAKDLAIRFYQSLVALRNLDQAYQEAIQILKSQKNTKDHLREAFLREDKDTKTSTWGLSVAPKLPTAGQWSFVSALHAPLVLLPALPKMVFPALPFPWLEAYDYKKAIAFGGRDNEIFRLYKLLTKDLAHPVLLLSGIKGVGKTSLLQAGLIPRLEQEYKVTYISDSPENFSHKWPNILKATNNSTTEFVLLDGLEEVKPTILEHIGQLPYTPSTTIRFIISVEANFQSNWKKALQEKSIDYTPFYLTPLSTTPIKRWLEELNQSNSLVIDKKVINALSVKLTQDDQSSIAPFLQWYIKKIWINKRQINNQIHLDLSTIQEIKDQKIWMLFIEHQMEKANKAAYESGLLLNILSDCTDIINDQQWKQVQDKYQHLSDLPFTYFIKQLKEHYLLAHPAASKSIAKHQLRIAHDLLREPLLILLNQSNRSGQLAKRLITTHLETTDFSEEKIKLIEEGRQAMPNLLTDIITLLERSKSNQRKRKKIRNWVNVIQWLIIIIILSLGHFFDNPYLLLYIILLIILYRYIG